MYCRQGMTIKYYQDGNRFQYHYYQRNCMDVLYRTYCVRSVEEEKKLNITSIIYDFKSSLYYGEDLIISDFNRLMSSS